MRAIVIRYAAIGDAIQASSPIAELSDMGYEVDVITSADGAEILKHDPHIANIKVIAPTDAMGDYGQWLEEYTKGYDLVANLTGCVEGELALEPTSRSYYLPAEVRRNIYGRINYVERQHALANVPYRGNRQWFYEAEEERDQVVDSLGGKKSIGIALSGSHTYKIWPKIADFCRLLLQKHRARLVLIGSLEARDYVIQRQIYAEIEAHLGPLDSPDFEIMSMLGAPVRMSMAMACHVDTLIGFDSGLTNAAAMRPNRKIVLLTHNTIDNICIDWRNTWVITSKVPCSPCIRLRHRNGDCPQVDGHPACVQAIAPETVMASL